MLYFPMDFGESNNDGLIDTGALSSAIPEADLRKIRLLAPHTVINEGPPPEFQIMVANGQLEAPIATVELQFEVGNITFREKFIVMTNLTSPLIDLLFLQRNSTILDMRQGILNFPFFPMQLKNEDRTYPNVIEPILNPAETILQPGKRSTISVKSQIYTESASENTTLKRLLRTIIRKLNGKLTIILLSHKMTYTQLHGKQNLVDSYLTFLSYILILMQSILMKVIHRDQILSLSHVLFFMMQSMVKTGKLVPVLTQLYYILQILNRMVKVRTLRPPQT